MTPEMASDWVSHRTYDKNRKVSKSVVSKYRQDMEKGRWKVARNAGLIFDTYGKIIDGGNRLTALANCDAGALTEKYGTAAIAFWVYPEEPRDTFDVLDQGFKRQAAHLLGIPNSSAVAAGARYLAALSDEDQWGMPRFGRVTNPEIYSMVQEWPELSRYAKNVMDVRLATWITGAPHLAVLSQAARTEYATKIPEWIRGLETGDSLSVNDSRLRLRNRFISSRHLLAGGKNRIAIYGMIAKSWNFYAEDQEMSVLRWRPNEGLTQVTGFDWSMHNISKES